MSLGVKNISMYSILILFKSYIQNNMQLFAHGNVVQLAERQTFNLFAAGSSPVIFNYDYLNYSRFYFIQNLRA